MEAIPADDGGVQGHQHQQREVSPQAGEGRQKILPGKVKIEEPSDSQGDEVQDQGIVIGVLVDKTDIQEDQHDIKGAEQPYGSFLFRGNMSQANQYDIQPVGGENRRHDKKQQQNVLVIFPVRGSSRYLFVQYIVQGKKQQYGCAGENHFVKTFDKDEMFFAHLAQSGGGTLSCMMAAAKGSLDPGCGQNDGQYHKKPQKGNQ